MKIPNVGTLVLLRSGDHREIELDFVRSIAILLAIGWHFNHTTYGGLAAQILLWPGATFGWAGVDLFFVLSGFLIGRILFEKLAKTGKFNVTEFYIHRIFKIWPVLYLFLLAMVIGAGRPLREFLPQIGLHVQNYFPPTLALHLWSLAVEEHFYLAVSVALIMSVKFRWHQRTLVLGLLATLLIAPILRIAAFEQGFSPDQIQWQTQFRIDALAAGLLLAWVAVQRPLLMQNILRYRFVFAALAVFGVVVLSLTTKGSFFTSTIGFSVAYITAAAFILSVYDGYLFRKGSVLSRLFVGLSMISYALYIFHVPTAEAVARLGGKLGLAQHSIPLIVMSYLLSFLVAYVVTVLVEQPSLQARRFLMEKLRRRTVAVA